MSITCAYCNEVPVDGRLTKDHVIPRNRCQDRFNLRYDPANIRMVCHACNFAKGDLIPGDAAWDSDGMPVHAERRQRMTGQVATAVAEVVTALGIRYVRLREAGQRR